MTVIDTSIPFFYNTLKKQYFCFFTQVSFFISTSKIFFHSHFYQLRYFCASPTHPTHTLNVCCLKKGYQGTHRAGVDVHHFLERFQEDDRLLLHQGAQGPHGQNGTDQGTSKCTHVCRALRRLVPLREFTGGHVENFCRVCLVATWVLAPSPPPNHFNLKKIPRKFPGRWEGCEGFRNRAWGRNMLEAPGGGSSRSALLHAQPWNGKDVRVYYV